MFGRKNKEEKREEKEARKAEKREKKESKRTYWRGHLIDDRRTDDGRFDYIGSEDCDE